MKENTIATNFEPHECVIFVQSTKIGTHENKAIHSMNTTIRAQVGKVCNISNLQNTCELFLSGREILARDYNNIKS